MCLSQCFLCSFAALGVCAAVAQAQPTISERFESGLNDWTVFADGSNLTWEAGTGNPGGCARATDLNNSILWGFTATAPFLGDKSCYYGGTLAWDVQTTHSSSAYNTQADVRIEAPIGAGGATVTLCYNVPGRPVVNMWTPQSVVLTETDWRVGTIGGVAATQAQFQAALANITSLKFNCEWSASVDTGRIDNVVFTPPPAPLPGCSACDSTDFNNDGLFPDTADIDDFLSVFSGGPCSTGTCNDTDFNNDGLFPDTLDIDALLSVFSGGACL